MKPTPKTRFMYPALLLIAASSIIFMIAEIANEHFLLSDFKVYYTAAERLLNGITLYRHPEDLHYIFKYSPFSAALFIPFTLIPLGVAKVVYWLFLTVVIMYGFRIAVQLSESLTAEPNRKQSNIVLMFAILILALHFLRELHLGQVNHLLLVMYLIMLQQYLKGNEKSTAILFAITFFIKPFTLIFLPYFFIQKKYRLLVTCGITVICAGLFPFLFSGSWEHFMNENLAWINELKIEMRIKQSLLTYGNLTIFSVIARYSPLGFLTYINHGNLILQLLVLFVMAMLYLWYFKSGNKNQKPEIADFALLITTIPMLAYTSANAFGFTELAVILVLMSWSKMTRLIKSAALLAFILIGGNFAEIIGRNLSNEFDRYSLVTVGAAALLVVLFNLRKKQVV